MGDRFESIFIIVMIIWVLAGVFSTKKGKKGRQQGRNTLQQPMKGGTPAPAVIPQTGRNEKPVPSRSGAPAFGTPVIQPTLHDHSGMYNGSMGDQLIEGMDPHDHGFENDAELPSSNSAEDINRTLRQTGALDDDARPGLTLDWNGSAMVKAFVMQEVLKRPCERNR